MKIITFGCRINTYESALIRQWADDLPHVIVVNTCAVTAEAERQCRQTIRKLRKENPNDTLIVTGCAAQLHPEIYAAMPEVDRVLGNREKLSKDFLTAKDPLLVGDIDNVDFDIPPVHDFDGRCRAFLQVQQGCDHRCTFCIVNKVRGRNKGLSPDDAVRQAQTFVNNGYKELVITGIDVTSYPYGLSDLIERIIREVKGLKRLRLGSLDPAGVDDKMIDLFKNEEKIMPHAHLSIQSGDNLILKRMGRRHSREDVFELVQKFKTARPDMVFGSDFITGFPTETEEMFRNTLDLVAKADILLLHVFPFSVRPETPSAKMPMVPAEIRKKRAAALRLLGQKRLVDYLDRQGGKKESVLVEKEGVGLNAHYITTHVPQNLKAGEIVDVIIEGRTENELVAKIT